MKLPMKYKDGTIYDADGNDWLRSLDYLDADKGQTIAQALNEHFAPKLKVWIARDMEFSQVPDSRLFLYLEKPEYDDINKCFMADRDSYVSLKDDLFSEVAPGACVEAEITLKPANVPTNGVLNLEGKV